ncbi:MAG: hypothetical protein RHS_0580 [Robinsoniella sp. RHS]|nr:MAG: hypothetical protein RHS_0580 [Robinsoniella sp. RHS]
MVFNVFLNVSQCKQLQMGKILFAAAFVLRKNIIVAVRQP